jgi:transposase
VAEFPATAAGHRELLGWLSGFGPVARVGVEGTGSYGAGLARFLRAAGVAVVEVDRPNRQARRRAGKSDPLDAVEAARAALSGRARGAAKSRDGNVEAIRALVVAKRSARSAKIQALNQIPARHRHDARGSGQAGRFTHLAGARHCDQRKYRARQAQLAYRDSATG